MCNLCDHAKGAQAEKDADRFFGVLQNSGWSERECRWARPYEEQAMAFRVCTPTKAEIEELDEKEDLRELDKYKEFIRGGVGLKREIGPLWFGLISIALSSKSQY